MSTTHSQRAETRRSWQFSLRELFLASIALCALLALGVKTVSRSNTQFVLANGRLDPQAHLTNLGSAVGPALAVSASSSGYSSSPYRAHANYNFHVTSPGPNEAEGLMWRFRESIRDQLKKANVHMMGQGRSGDEQRKTCTEFTFDYEKGNLQGTIDCMLLKSEGPGWQLRVRVFEVVPH